MTAGLSRRALLQVAGAASLSLVFCTTGFAKTQRVIDPRRFGARGDGRTDDTRALQRAIDMAEGGGIVDVPAGVYLIDAKHSLVLRNGVHLRLAQGAELHAIPNELPRAYVLLIQRVSDVKVTGGRIVGERDRHMGTTGEWGHGIAIYGGVRVAIRDIRIERCWGDGISIGGKKSSKTQLNPSTDIEIANITCVGNRRQGLSVGRSRRVWVHDSTFTDTGGTPPSAGIDVEPDKGDITKGVRIERCVCKRNRGPGIQVWHDTFDVEIRDCTLEENRNTGILAVGAQDLLIRNNRIRGNRNVGIALRKKSANVTIAGNVLEDNAPGRPRASRNGRDPRWARHLEVAPDVVAVRVADDNRLN